MKLRSKKLKLLFGNGFYGRNSLKLAQIFLTLSFFGICLGAIFLRHIFTVRVLPEIILTLIVVPFAYLFIGRLLRHARRTLDTQNLFVSNVEHELRGPLSSMVLSAEKQLLDVESRDEIGEAHIKTNNLIQNLRKDLGGLHNMASIIHNLSIIASYEHRSGGMNLRPVDLPILLKRICEEVAATTADPKDIRINFAAAAPPRILGNESALEQMIRNLLSNAVKYSPRGSSVFAAVSETGKEVILSIKDTGIGISQDDMAKVFDPFFRSHALLARKEVGSGLGLTIVREVAREHKANLFVKSVLGKGTEVFVNFPVPSPQVV